MAKPRNPQDNPARPDTGDGEVAVETAKPRLAQPPKFAVLLLNDDYSTMEFVIEVLTRFFGKDEKEAYDIMMKVHREGKGVAGIYSFEIAETKCSQVHDLAKERGYPLKCVVEEL
jgi:ATP-dependent Clp protease adaptor protein ClpS